MHYVYLLAFVTFLIVLAVLLWQRMSVRRAQRAHGETPGEVGLTPPAQRPEPRG